MTYFDMSQLSRGTAAIGRMVQEHEDEAARLQADLTAALARAEAARARVAELEASVDTALRAEGGDLNPWRTVAVLAAERNALAGRVAELTTELELLIADVRRVGTEAQAWRPATDKPEDGQDGRIVLRAQATESLGAPGVFYWKIDHRYVCHADVEQWQPSAPVTQEMAS